MGKWNDEIRDTELVGNPSLWKAPTSEIMHKNVAITGTWWVYVVNKAHIH